MNRVEMVVLSRLLERHKELCKKLDYARVGGTLELAAAFEHDARGVEASMVDAIRASRAEDRDDDSSAIVMTDLSTGKTVEFKGRAS